MDTLHVALKFSHGSRHNELFHCYPLAIYLHSVDDLITNLNNCIPLAGLKTYSYN